MLLSPTFESYAQRDAGIGITSINVMFVLRNQDFARSLVLLERIEHELLAYPSSWRPFLGTLYPAHGAPPVRIEPILFRSRALALIHKLRSIIKTAAKDGKYVVYGNGVTYRALCGIKLPAGTEFYS
jgi:hypothetical protein